MYWNMPIVDGTGADGRRWAGYAPRPYSAARTCATRSATVPSTSV